MAYVRAFVLLVAAFLVLSSEGHTIEQRSPKSTNDDFNSSSNTKADEPITELCLGRTPCGWAVYNRNTRYLQYFMKNRCVCVPSRRCVKQDDDISITAYVYRCKVIDEHGQVVVDDD